MSQQYAGQSQGRQAAQPLPFDHSQVTAAFELPNRSIVTNFGLVRGIIVRSRSVVGQIGASFQTLFGGNISFTPNCVSALAAMRTRS